MAWASMARRGVDDADSAVESEVPHATGRTASPGLSTTGMAGERRVWRETSGGGRFAKVKAVSRSPPASQEVKDIADQWLTRAWIGLSSDPVLVR